MALGVGPLDSHDYIPDSSHNSPCFCSSKIEWIGVSPILDFANRKRRLEQNDQKTIFPQMVASLVYL